VALDLDKVMDAAREGHRWRNPIWRRPDGSFAEW
jgi:galactonate dehydratase